MAAKRAAKKKGEPAVTELAKRLAEEFDCETGAEGDPAAFRAIAEYCEETQTEIPAEHLGMVVAVAHAAYQAGEASKSR